MGVKKTIFHFSRTKHVICMYSGHRLHEVTPYVKLSSNFKFARM